MADNYFVLRAVIAGTLLLSKETKWDRTSQCGSFRDKKPRAKLTWVNSHKSSRDNLWHLGNRWTLGTKLEKYHMHPSFWLFKWKSSALSEEARAASQGVLCSNKLPLLSFLMCFFFPHCLCAVKCLDLSSVFVASVYTCVQNIKCESWPTVGRDVHLILTEGLGA